MPVKMKSNPMIAIAMAIIQSVSFPRPVVNSASKGCKDEKQNAYVAQHLGPQFVLLATAHSRQL
jgi:hypothetical protein